MKFTLAAVAALMLFAPVAKADIITCSFTEPFVTTTYSMSKSTLTITEDVEQKSEVIKNVSFQIKGAGEFVLMTKDKKVIQKLKLNNKGSNGMSDHVYPMEGIMGESMVLGNLVGGCESNYLKAKLNQ